MCQKLGPFQNGGVRWGRKRTTQPQHATSGGRRGPRGSSRLHHRLRVRGFEASLRGERRTWTKPAGPRTTVL